MVDLIQKALAAKRESKHVEFKQEFDPSSHQDWCEVIKDVVAIANSGGGVIVFGLDNVGTPTGISVDAIARIDPAHRRIVCSRGGGMSHEHRVNEREGRVGK